MKKIYLFAVIFALIAGFATFFFVNSLQHNSSITGVEESDVVVAVQDIEPDTVASPEMFKTIRMPVSSITYGTFSNADEISGLVVKEKIYKGEQVMSAKFASVTDDVNLQEYNGEYHLSYHLEKGNYAYTFKADEPDAVAYFIKRGDYINVYDIRKSDPGPVLKNVKVLEIGMYSDRKMADEGTETTSYTLITVSLTEKQIEAFIPYDETHSNADPFHVVLVPYAEGAGLSASSSDSGSKAKSPATNNGMGELETPEPKTEKAR